MTGTRLVALLLAAGLAACSSPNPVLYTIAPVQGPVQSGGPKVIVLQQISTAHYLERSQIVRSSENYRLDVIERLVGRAAAGNAEPSADRGTGPAPAAEHRDRRD